MWKQRKRLGLALSGGMARGRAHVGVIQALEEAGIHADFVSGVSAGALVGAAYAAGLSMAELEPASPESSTGSRSPRPSCRCPVAADWDGWGCWISARSRLS